jgi:hypothetical protein
MCSAMVDPASCEIRTVIHCLYAKIVSVVEIQRELCSAVYGQNVMSEGTVRQCVECLKKGE